MEVLGWCIEKHGRTGAVGAWLGGRPCDMEIVRVENHYRDLDALKIHS